MFLDSTEILEAYHSLTYPTALASASLDQLQAASLGMYPGEYIENQSSEVLRQNLQECFEKKHYPIVQDDSLTAWANLAVEQFGLEIRDIATMKRGEQRHVILMDKNTGDYLHGQPVGSRFDPRKRGFSYGIYTHNNNLTGKLEFNGIVHDPFTWEVNGTAYGEPWWTPLRTIAECYGTKRQCPKKWTDLDSQTKVGWRGPAIDQKDAIYLPKEAVHYGTWWNDYAPFRIQNYLTVPREMPPTTMAPRLQVVIE